HEAGDHAMERHAVVELLARQRLDLRDVVRRQVGAHLDHHRAADAGLHDQRVVLVLLRRGRQRGRAGQREDERDAIPQTHFLAPLTSAATDRDVILSGSVTVPLPGAPRLILSTCSMPTITSPHTVYWPSRKLAFSKQMKNWLSALLGSWARAIEQVPRTCLP